MWLSRPILSLTALLLISSVASPQDNVVQRKTLSKPGTVIEAETLLPRAKASAGPLSAQDMRGFGSQWGGGAQLFWRPPAPVDTPIRSWPSLTLPLDVATDGLYNVTLYFTAAPDYGNVRVFLRGKAVGDFSGYGMGVSLRNLSVGQQDLKAGSNQLVLTVFGKEGASSNHLVGLDRISVQPVAGKALQSPNDSAGAAQSGAVRKARGAPQQLVLAPLPPLMAPQQQQQLLVQGGADPSASAQGMLILTAARMYEQGVGRISLTDVAMFAPPDYIVINGLEDGQAYATLVTKPGQFYIVNFVIQTSSGGALLGESEYDSIPFKVEVATGNTSFQSQTMSVKSDSGWHDVPVVFKAVGYETGVSLRRVKPGMWHLGRVEIAVAK